MIRSCISAWFIPWLAAALGLLSGCSESGSSFSGADMRGQELFDLHCALCHEMANPDLRKQPPKLERLFQSRALPSGAPATDAQVRKTIIEGLGTMPAFDQRLNPKDVDHIVRYLHTRK